MEGIPISIYYQTKDFENNTYKYYVSIQFDNFDVIAIFHGKNLSARSHDFLCVQSFQKMQNNFKLIDCIMKFRGNFRKEKRLKLIQDPRETENR